MKKILFAFLLGATLISCQKQKCYTCSRDYYDIHGSIGASEVLETECGISDREYQKLKTKYPMQFKPQAGVSYGWYYHCDAE